MSNIPRYITSKNVGNALILINMKLQKFEQTYIKRLLQCIFDSDFNNDHNLGFIKLWSNDK